MEQHSGFTPAQLLEIKNEISYKMFKTNYEYVALDGCKVAVLEDVIKRIADAPNLYAQVQKQKEVIEKLVAAGQGMLDWSRDGSKIEDRANDMESALLTAKEL